MPRTVRVDKNLVPGHPTIPVSLSPGAAAHWYRLAAEIGTAGILLSTAHGSALALAAGIADDLDTCRAVVLVDGAFIKKGGALEQHPASKRIDALRRDYLKVLSMLGIRAAVASAPIDEDETLDEMLDG
jgi:hypothetical protein